MRAQAVSGRDVCEQGRLPRAPGLTVAGVTQAPIARRAPGSIPQRIPQRILVHEVEVCQVMRRPGRAVGGAEPERGDLFWASPWNRRVRLWLGVRRRFSISSAVFEVTASKFPAGSFRQGGAGGRQPHRTPESWLASTSLQAFEPELRTEAAAQPPPADRPAEPRSDPTAPQPATTRTASTPDAAATTPDTRTQPRPATQTDPTSPTTTRTPPAADPATNHRRSRAGRAGHAAARPGTGDEGTGRGPRRSLARLPGRAIYVRDLPLDYPTLEVVPADRCRGIRGRRGRGIGHGNLFFDLEARPGLPAGVRGRRARVPAIRPPGQNVGRRVRTCPRGQGARGKTRRQTHPRSFPLALT